MARFAERRYQSRVALAMVSYVAVLLLVWPLARSTASQPLKLVLALLPTLPVLYVIWQMARRVWHADELEQRTHLVALGTSTAIVGVASLIGGFLAAAGVVRLDGSILLWVFPVMLISYQAARWWVVRHYGNEPACAGDEDGIALRWRVLLVAGLLAVVGAFAWHRHEAFDGLFVGMAAAAVLVVLVQGVLRWRRRRSTGRSPREA